MPKNTFKEYIKEYIWDIRKKRAIVSVTGTMILATLIGDTKETTHDQIHFEQRIDNSINEGAYRGSNGEYGTALNIFLDVIKEINTQTPNNEKIEQLKREAYYFTGKIYKIQGDYKNALLYLEQAAENIQSPRKRGYTEIDLGIIYHELEKRQENKTGKEKIKGDNMLYKAEEDLEKAILELSQKEKLDNSEKAILNETKKDRYNVRIENIQKKLTENKLQEAKEELEKLLKDNDKEEGEREIFMWNANIITLEKILAEIAIQEHNIEKAEEHIQKARILTEIIPDKTEKTERQKIQEIKIELLTILIRINEIKKRKEKKIEKIISISEEKNRLMEQREEYKEILAKTSFEEATRRERAKANAELNIEKIEHTNTVIKGISSGLIALLLIWGARARDNTKKKKKLIKNNNDLQQERDEKQGIIEERQVMYEELMEIHTRLIETNKELIKTNNEKESILKELEEKNSVMEEDAQGGRTFQKTLYPKEKEIRKHLPEFFIYDKPKNILSGDYHRLKATKSHIYLAVIDTTGHGTKRSLLHLIMKNILDETLESIEMSDEKTEEKAVKILTETINRGLNKWIKEGNKESCASMIMCQINKKTNIMKYVRTKSIEPIYIRSKWKCTEEKWWEIKEEGKDENGKTYTNIRKLQQIGEIDNQTLLEAEIMERKLSAGDRVYIFTDGIADQISKDGEKFKRKWIRNLITTANQSKLCMEAQERFFRKEIHNREKNPEKIFDDQTIFAFEVPPLKEILKRDNEETIDDEHKQKQLSEEESTAKDQQKQLTFLQNEGEEIMTTRPEDLEIIQKSFSMKNEEQKQ